MYNYLINERQFYYGSSKKEIPNVVLQSSWNIQNIFLKYLYEGDGGISNPDKSIVYNSQSIKLLQQIQIVLANKGIFSYIGTCPDKRNENPCYKLYIKEKYNIKILHERKISSLGISMQIICLIKNRIICQKQHFLRMTSPMWWRLY